ncbi:metal ABC transporter solute-binding protein, Zn/Mn family [Aerococcus sanguinicola]|uniref:metal ABC transporter solute-binding protein, Zn/Mn family n=1 Tax=unclassified Aerococcus TaxID=2618060 RepID=UPI0008A52D80|nr:MULTISPECIES: zinc ABC transporter substrate-binding protein [unclassified Aerococcus]MDK6234016.1 zinc ABC transporter substrate-binding protein [Aerococcus sp. UMB10185]MDK6856549.1 zinc ABC transporter substrate-binding protein [Aerococcus sp. UMB7533]MDK8502027.1 zinc ABC transporter substrate-binding protein [Aerococcus sp. UMB1112A]OFN03578.1 metal transporter [Aerococcus sp. HMSC062A02]OHO45793.1 metal transporter [Aerococcus sp. HMSC035B07]
MSKWLKTLGLLVVGVFVLSACSKGSDQQKSQAEGGKLNVVVTTSFLNDMVQQLAGDYVSSNMIIPAGEDPHLYEAKPQDLEKLKGAELLIYHGLHFEGKMVDVLEQRGKAVTADFDEKALGNMDQDGETIVDPHFWFDIDLYKQATEKCSAYLIEALPEHKEAIEKNTAAYLKQLDDLDQENKEKIAGIPEAQRYLITPHDAFNYFSRRYNIPVKAPQGVSTDTEVANKDIEDTVNFIVDHKIKAIFSESTTDPARMKKLQEACKAKGFDVKVVSGEGQELFSDSLAPVGQTGDNFIDMYRHNVDLITNNLK